MLISRLIEEFESYMLTERGASEATIVAYRSTLSRLSDFLADGGQAAEFETVRTADLRRLVSDIKQTGASNARIARHVHAVRSFWRFVVETYDLGSNAALPLRAPKPDHRVPQVLSPEECQKLIDAAGRNYYKLYRIRDRALLKLMLVIGLRRGEVIGLRITDYSSGDGTLRVVMSKGRTSRVVPLTPDLCADINAWLAVRPSADHDYLLTTRTGNPLSPTCLYRSMSSLVKSAGLELHGITPHVLRHTAATLVLKGSGDLVATSRLLGHSSVAVTGDTYCHLTNDDIRRAVNYHPLAGRQGDTHLIPESGDPSWQLPIPDDRKDIVAEVDEMVAAALAEYHQTIAQHPDLEERFRDYCIVEAIRHNMRPNVPVPEDVVRAVAWEGRVVERYSLAEHTRMVTLRDVLLELPNMSRSTVPWSQMLAAIAERLSPELLRALEPWHHDRLDQIGTIAMTDQNAEVTALTRFTQLLAQAAVLDAFGDDCLLVAQIAANIAVSNLSIPITFFPTWLLPVVRIAVNQARHGDASVLCAVGAAQIARLCAEAMGVGRPW